MTYWPIREIVLQAAGIADSRSSSGTRSRLAGLLGDVPQAEIVADRIATCIGLEGNSAPKAEIFWAIRRFLEESARARPTVVVVEDLEWAEDTLLDLIDYVLDLATDAPLLVVATTGCGLKGPLTLPSRSDETVIRGPGQGQTELPGLLCQRPGGAGDRPTVRRKGTQPMFTWCPWRPHFAYQEV